MPLNLNPRGSKAAWVFSMEPGLSPLFSSHSCGLNPRSHFPYQKTIPHPRLAIPSFFRYFPIMQEKEKAEKSFEDSPLAQAILREGLLIQDRFSAEPIYAKTGKGYLKSVGVEEIARVKSEAKTKTS